MNEYYFAWWNLENLFDVEDSPDRPDYLKKSLKKELKGWTAEILAKKITQLAKIIKQMNGGAGPDLMGICEVENENVVAQLRNAFAMPGRAYEIVHHDTNDGRGIDVAFIYDSAKFTAGGEFHHVVMKRNATREIYQVNFTTNPDGNVIILIGNHWPSRRGGQYPSEPYRMIAGETLAYWHERIREEVGKEAAVVSMGDYNDEPFNRSLIEYALAISSRKKVVSPYARNPWFYNLMWRFLGHEVASYYFSSTPNMLDQFLVSEGMLKDDSIFSVDEDSVEIIRFPEMLKGDYDAPREFGRPSGTLDVDGFSDHFPIGMVVRET